MVSPVLAAEAAAVPAAAAQQQTIEIPLADAHVLELSLSELPGNEANLLNILLDNKVPMTIYLQFAYNYYDMGLVPQAEQFLVLALERSRNAVADATEEETVLLLQTLAHLYLECARRYATLARTLPVAELGPHWQSREQLLVRAAALVKEIEQDQAHHGSGKPTASTHVAKGTGMMALGDDRSAEAQFVQALTLDPDHPAALLGRATINARKGEWGVALSHYQAVFRAAPAMTPSPRLPIAICLYNLGVVVRAQQVVERVLELEPHNVTAHALYCLMAHNLLARASQVKQPQLTAEPAAKRSPHLKAASQSPENPLVSLLLAERFFKMSKFPTVQLLTENMLCATQHPYLQALAYYYKGAVAHASENLPLAQQFMQQALKLQPDLVVARYALATTLMVTGTMQDALTMFEELQHKLPDNYHILRKRVACLNALKQTQHARPLLEHMQKLQRMAASKQPVAAGAPAATASPAPATVGQSLDLLQLYQVSQDVSQCLTQTEKVYQILAPPPSKQLSSSASANPSLIFIEANRAALSHATGDLARAQTLYTSCLQRLEGATDPDAMHDHDHDAVGEHRYRALAITTRYNYARLLEDLERPAEADEIYRQLLETTPDYIDAILRRAVLAEALAHRPATALQLFKRALEIDPKYIETWLCLAHWAMQKRNYRLVKRSLERIPAEIDRHDTFALVHLGFLNFQMGRMEARMQETQKAAHGRPEQPLAHYRGAFQFFEKAIRLQDANLLAAMGMALCLSELGAPNDAYTILHSLMGSLPRAVCAPMLHATTLEAAPPHYLVTYNTAILALLKGDARAAIAACEALAKWMPFHAQVWQLLAKSYYTLAKMDKQLEAMDKAVRYCQRALHYAPWDKSLWFDLALVKQQRLHLLNEQPSEKRTSQRMAAALWSNSGSVQLFKALAQMIKGMKQRGDKDMLTLGFDYGQAMQRSEYGRELNLVAEKKRHQSAVLEAQRQERLEMIRQQQQEKERAEREEAERQREQREQREAEILRQRREMEEKMAALNEAARL
ncbi:hypothetical protein CXG81DRAFT_10729, partial [Caulochytrium protostelioides]